MAEYQYPVGYVVVVPGTDDIAENRADGVLYDLDGNPVQAYSLDGIPLAYLSSGPKGLLEPFTADIAVGRVSFSDGAMANVYSVENMLAVTEARAAQAAAEAAMARAFPVSNVGLDPDGVPYVSTEPVAIGGTFVINQDGSVDAVFPY